jgi:hypothetical protein
MAHPKPWSSATPAMKAFLPVRERQREREKARNA